MKVKDVLQLQRDQSPVSQKYLKAEMIVKFILQTFISLRGVSQSHCNLRYSYK